MSDIKREIVNSMDQYIGKYKKWILVNPKVLSEIETIVKWGSYLIAGRFMNSTLMSEIAYSGSKLFELFNDCLIRGTLPHLSTDQENKFKLLLCIVDSMEVVLEIGAQQCWGEAGKWAVVATITLIKLIWRLVLLIKYKMKVLPNPAIPALDRSLVNNNNNSVENDANHFNMQSQNCIKLPQSGYMLRSINSTPPPHLRTFLPPSPSSQMTTPTPTSSTTRSPKQLIAELLHIFRPASHLTSIYMFGQKSWLPYILALGMDLTSLQLYKTARLSESEKSELSRRYKTLLLYFLRSPVYGRVTKDRLVVLLTGVGNNVPLTHSICNSLIRLSEHWNDVYSYSWMV